jgi:formylglycine-generating enzyme required for sulfatase activity
MTQVFISYSRKDIAFIEQLVVDLKIADLEAWYDLSGLEGGSHWRKEIEKAIKASQYVVVVLSPDAVTSTWVEEEILYAKHLGKRIIPLLFRTCEIPFGLHTLNFIDVRGGKYQQNHKEILRALDVNRGERQSARNTALMELLSSVMPFLRVIGILGVVIALFLAGSWVIPKFISLMTMPKATITMQRPVAPLTSTNSPVILTKTQTPTPVADITDAKGVSMVLVPAGEFIMGSNNGAGDQYPAHVVYLASFHIDKYEVTNNLYKACVDANACVPLTNTASYTHSDYYENPQFDNYPVIYVNWNMSKKFCEWRGARLPTEAEWEKAARGTDGRTYPWGEGIDKTFANYDLNVGDTTPVGTYEKGKSVYGVYDLAGNVLEWVADFYDVSYYATLGSNVVNPLGPSSGETYVLRGGSFPAADYLLTSSYRTAAVPEYSLHFFGFRCAQNANP